MFQVWSKTIAATGVAQPISTTQFLATRVIIQNSRAGELVTVGDSTVTAGTGFELIKPVDNVFGFPLILEGANGNDLDLNQIYIVGTKDKVVNCISVTL
jgi:hypothetical protein